MSTRRLVTLMSSFALPVVLATVSGCSAESGTSGRSTTDTSALAKDPSATSAGNAAPAGGEAARGHRPPGGPEFLLFAALHDLELSAAQKADIEAAIEAIKPAAPPAEAKAQFAALAAGVRAGKVDPASLASSVPEGQPDAHRDALAKAIQKLHDTLTTAQRVQLVDTLDKRAQEFGAGHPHGRAHERKGPEGHGPDGKRAHAGPPPGGPHDPVAMLTQDLGLSAEQETRIREKIAAERPAPKDPAAMKAQFDAMRADRTAKMNAFKADAFDAKAFVTPPAGAPAVAHGPRAHFERMAKELQIITVELNAEQRNKLAARIEQGPPRPEHRPMQQPSDRAGRPQ
jgi:hypothetical protein